MIEQPAQQQPVTANQLYKGDTGDTGNSPIIIKSGLKLDPVRLEWLIDRVITRINETRDEMGVVVGGDPSPSGWMWHRKNYQDQYDNSWEWRKALGGIFEYSNWSLNIPKRFARLLTAKSTDDLLGTDPFFAALSKKNRNPELAKQAEWFLQEKISASNFVQSTRRGMRGAVIRGESVLKVDYRFIASQFSGPGKVMVGKDQQPILTPKGNLIFEKDDIIPDPSIQGVYRLLKEPSFQMPLSGVVFRFFESLPQLNVEYEGVGVEEVFFTDFGCPLKVDTIYDADINFHVFDQDYEVLKAKYGLLPLAASYFNNGFQAGKQQPKEKAGEQVSTAGRDRQIVNCADVYIRADADGDGQHEEIWMVLDLQNQKAIWYDYRPNHMARRPFGVIHGVEDVESRWYGVGVFEMLDHKGAYIDTQFNRLNFKSSKASSMRFINKNAVSQWKAGQQPVLGDDQFYEIDDPTFTKDMPPAFEVKFGENDPEGMALLQTQMQACATEVGVMGPDDGENSGLDSTKLATGIRALERTGNQLMKSTEQVQAKGVENLLDLAIDTVLSNMDEEELVYHPDTDRLIDLNREEIRRLNKDIKLTLSRTRSTETLENSSQVINLVNQYYDLVAQDPFRAQKLRPEYIRQLKALEVQDADELLIEVTDDMVKAFQDQKANAQTQEIKNSRGISAKLGDLAPSERAQALQQEGIQAASPEELAADRAQKQADKQAERAANKPPEPQK